jgi:hypothetical protein
MTMSALVSPDRRIRLVAQSAVASNAPELETVFVGKSASKENFAAATAPRAAAADLGFTPASGDLSLNSLPLAFTDAGSFAQAFPDDDSWLARAVNDFFAAGGLRAWVVRVEVDPADPLAAYIGAVPPAAHIGAVPPDAYIGALTPTAYVRSPLFPVPLAPQSGFAIAAQVDSAGLVVFPDLEYDCLASIAPPPLAPPPLPQPAAFRPLKDFIEPSSGPGALTKPAVPVVPFDALTRISRALAALRPDMICLFALPIGADPTLSQPAMVNRAVTYLRGPKALDGGNGAIPRVLGGSDQPRVQAFAPLLRDALGRNATPSGLAAGLFCARAETLGVWRSLAGGALPLGATPLRRIESNALAELRNCGVVVLKYTQGATVLDDDILACQQHQSGSGQLRAAGGRRLMGWLVRELRSYGEQLVFENVVDDGRVELVLTSLFAELFKQGALQGGQLSDAVRITRRRDLSKPNAYAFDIQIATAVAVETIRLQFLEGAVTASLGAAA